jgi:hypothetical protein
VRLSLPQQQPKCFYACHCACGRSVCSYFVYDLASPRIQPRSNTSDRADIVVDGSRGSRRYPFRFFSGGWCRSFMRAMFALVLRAAVPMSSASHFCTGPPCCCSYVFLRAMFALVLRAAVPMSPCEPCLLSSSVLLFLCLLFISGDFGAVCQCQENAGCSHQEHGELREEKVFVGGPTFGHRITSLTELSDYHPTPARPPASLSFSLYLSISPTRRKKYARVRFSTAHSTLTRLT